MKHLVHVLALVLVSGVTARAQSGEDSLARLRAEPTLVVADEIGMRLRGDDAALVAVADALAKSSAWTHRRVAARLLGWARDAAVLDAAFERHRLDGDEAWPVREEVMLAIAGGDGHTARIARAMQDPFVDVRLAAVRAAALSATTAGDASSAVLARALRRALTDEARDVRLAAATVLAVSGDVHDFQSRATLRRVLAEGLPTTLARKVAASLIEGLPRRPSPDDLRVPPFPDGAADVFVRYVEIMPPLHLEPPGPARPIPVDEALELLESSESRSRLGTELVDVLTNWLPAGNPRIVDYLLESSRTAASREVCRAALGAAPGKALCEAMLDDVLQGRDPVATAVDELAARPVAGRDEILERFVVDDHDDREVRRTALRILMAGAWSPADATRELLRGADAFVLATEFARRRWDSDELAVRREVVADVTRWLAAGSTRRLGEGVLLVICRSPRPEAAALLRARLPAARHRTRSAIIDALAELADESSMDALRGLLAESDDLPSIHRIERHLVARGDLSVVDEILRRAESDDENWEGSSLDDLITLQSVEDARVAEFAERRLRRRRFDDRTLGRLLDIVSARRGRDAAVAHLRSILARAAGGETWPGRVRQPLSGNVVGHLLEKLDAVELVPLALSCLDTGRVTQIASVLDAVASIGRDGRVEGLDRLLLAVRRATPDGAADIERRSALLGPLVRCAGEAGLAVVREELASGIEALETETRHLDLRAEIVAQAAGVLVRDGGREGVLDVARAIVSSRDAELVTLLLWAFTETTDVVRVERMLIELQRGRGFALPPATLQTWAESAVAHRNSGHPIGFIADRILARPIQRSILTPRVLAGLAARLEARGDDDSALVARALLVRGLRLAGVRPRRVPASAGPRSAEPSWRTLAWRAAASGAPGGRTPRWMARDDVEYVLDVLDVDDASRFRQVAVLGLGLRSAEVLRAKIRRDLALGRAGSEDALVRALEVARALASASRVIPAGSPIHSRPAFEILEAAALWNLDRVDEALVILRRHGWPRRTRLPELTEEAFPGLDERR